jgi:hypothetical protein
VLLGRRGGGLLNALMASLTHVTPCPVGGGCVAFSRVPCTSTWERLGAGGLAKLPMSGRLVEGLVREGGEGGVGCAVRGCCGSCWGWGAGDAKGESVAGVALLVGLKGAV